MEGFEFVGGNFAQDWILTSYLRRSLAPRSLYAILWYAHVCGGVARLKELGVLLYSPARMNDIDAQILFP